MRLGLGLKLGCDNKDAYKILNKGKKDLSLHLEHVKQSEYLIHKEIEEYWAKIGKDGQVIAIFKKYIETIDTRVI